MNTEQKPRTYVPRSIAREVCFSNGGKILKVSFHAETLANFIKEHANERGYVNLVIERRREIGKHDETHNVRLDDWNPQEGFQKMKQTVQREQKQPALPAQQSDDVPF